MKPFTQYIKENKAVSAGFIIETPEGFLLTHPTGRPKTKGNWDIPKGHMETGEYPLETAIRELQEETGLEYNPDFKTTYLGEFDYTLSKNIILYHVIWPDTIDLKKLKCTSYFEQDGKQTPEANDFMLTDDLEFTFKSMQRCLRKAGIMK